MDSRKRKFPVTLMFDSDRLAKLEALSRGSDEPMSKLIRLSVGQLVERLGGPDRPDMNALAEMLRATD